MGRNTTDLLWVIRTPGIWDTYVQLRNISADSKFLDLFTALLHAQESTESFYDCIISYFTTTLNMKNVVSESQRIAL